MNHRQYFLFGLLGASLCFLAVSCREGIITSSSSEEASHTFDIILYDYAAFLRQSNEERSQSSTEAPPTLIPLDVWKDDELVGINWQRRTLEYGTTVRDRFGDETAVFIPDSPFEIEWDGKPIVRGWLILSMSPRVMNQPVLVYDPLALCDDERVVVRLLPNHWGDDLAPIAGLSQEVDAEMREYFSNRPALCPDGPQ
ncbi:MAG TPA: hypothetical protein PLC98_24655 [Anaerolineales bacterium]|nr:hypothetical protein [Anaerolineales bacterium]